MRLSRLLFLGSLAALLAGCTPSHKQSTFDPTGPIAQSQVNLFYVIFWAGLVVFIVVVGVLIYAAVRYRRRPGDGDPEQIHGHKRLEIAWTIAPAIVLAIVAVPTIITIFDNENSPLSPSEGGLEIEVTGHQWWFEFKYPSLDVTTANEMHIPVGEIVNIKLASVDVIHSFWVPKLAGKVDMIPNNANTMWIQANEPGEYYGQCAEFCGIAHARMLFRVIAQPRSEFDEWVEEQKAPAARPTDPLALLGFDLFTPDRRRGEESGQVTERDAKCSRCHTIKGTRLARGNIGPDLTHFASRRRFAGGILENTQAHLREWLEDPEKVKPGNIMARDAEVYTGLLPPLTEPEISALLAYLMGLK
jgi:cytochrome c oxidase subunit 2